MAKLVTLLEQHLDRQPPIVVIQATIRWEAQLAHVKLQECGLGVHLPARVRCCYPVRIMCTVCSTILLFICLLVYMMHLGFV